MDYKIEIHSCRKFEDGSIHNSTEDIVFSGEEPMDSRKDAFDHFLSLRPVEGIELEIKLFYWSLDGNLIQIGRNSLDARENYTIKELNDENIDVSLSIEGLHFEYSEYQYMELRHANYPIILEEYEFLQYDEEGEEVEGPAKILKANQAILEYVHYW